MVISQQFSISNWEISSFDTGIVNTGIKFIGIIKLRENSERIKALSTV